MTIRSRPSTSRRCWSATDADLDQVALDAGSLLITVEDDLPINNATSVTGAVDEDSLNNVSGAFGSLGNLDAVNVGTVAGGSLAGLVTVGADEPATRSALPAASPA